MPGESTTPDLVELLRDTLDAASRREADAFLSLNAPDAVWDLTRTTGSALEGRTAIGDFLTDWGAGYEELAVKVEEARDLGRGVLFGVLHQSGRPVGTSGLVEQREGWIFVFGEGLIERATAYQAVDDARAAAERLAEERG